MATKQRGPLPPVLSPEETRVKPLEEDEAELPPEEPSWDPQRDQTQLLPNTGVTPAWDEGVDDATPPVPRKIDPVPLDDAELQGPDEATRDIPRKTGALPALENPDEDATRHIPRKTGVRPAVQTPDDATRPIARKTGVRPAVQDPDDATRPIVRKTGVRPAVQDPDDSARDVPRKTGQLPVVTRASPFGDAPPSWDEGEGGGTDMSVLPTRAQGLPPIISGPQQQLVSPPHGPPVLVPVNTEPHYLPQAPVVPIVTQPNYVPPPPPVLNPIVTAPHLTPSAPPPPEAPPELDLRTTFSNKAAMVADLVKTTFARRSYGIAPYRLRIDEPDGPSTAGGLHARQPISLVSNLDSAPPILVGWVDVSKKESQLRSYAAVLRRHQSRYTSPMDINEEEYDRFLNELVETLFYGGIKIVLLVPDEDLPKPPGAQAQTQAQATQAQPQPAGRSCLGTLILVSLTFALGVGVGTNRENLGPWFEQAKTFIQNAIKR